MYKKKLVASREEGKAAASPDSKHWLSYDSIIRVSSAGRKAGAGKRGLPARSFTVA